MEVFWRLHRGCMPHRICVIQKECTTLYISLNIKKYIYTIDTESGLFKTYMHAKSLQSCPTLYVPMDSSHQAPLFMEFSRQEYWSELPCPSPGDLLNPGIKSLSFTSPALACRFFTTSATQEALKHTYNVHKE